MQVGIESETTAKFGAPAYVMKLSAKVGEKLDIFEGLGVGPFDLSQILAAMIGHFRLRRFKVECCIPGSTVRAVEPAALQTRIRKGGVQHSRIRNPEHQLVNADAGKQARLAQGAIICCALEF